MVVVYHVVTGKRGCSMAETHAEEPQWLLLRMRTLLLLPPPGYVEP